MSTQKKPFVLGIKGKASLILDLGSVVVSKFHYITMNDHNKHIKVPCPNDNEGSSECGICNEVYKLFNSGLKDGYAIARADARRTSYSIDAIELRETGNEEVRYTFGRVIAEKISTISHRNGNKYVLLNLVNTPRRIFNANIPDFSNSTITPIKEVKNESDHN